MYFVYFEWSVQVFDGKVSLCIGQSFLSSCQGTAGDQREQEAVAPSLARSHSLKLLGDAV